MTSSIVRNHGGKSGSQTEDYYLKNEFRMGNSVFVVQNTLHSLVQEYNSGFLWISPSFVLLTTPHPPSHSPRCSDPSLPYLSNWCHQPGRVFIEFYPASFLQPISHFLLLSCIYNTIRHDIFIKKTKKNPTRMLSDVSSRKPSLNWFRRKHFIQ